MSGSEDSTGRTSASALKLAITCAVLAICAGAAFWAWSQMVRSDPTQVAAASDPSSSDQPCALDEAVVAKIKAQSTGELRAFAAIDRPYSVADFAFKDESGADRTLTEWQGRTVLLNLWATWCVPCRAEMPLFDTLQAEMGGESFEVVTISVDKSAPDKPKGFFEEISIKALNFYHDSSAETLASLKEEGLALGLPATLLIDRRGCAVGRINGPAEWASDDARALVRAVF